MNKWDWITIAVHAVAAGVEAAVGAGREKRAQLQGEAPDLGWRERRAAADRERAAREQKP